ncbi:MAG: glycohydrolase toxin TNT-related protein [Proteobacteria bacterium]|nr:glycohydrolase toxin TNT-related protein [Pseudomonadota bacterium]
MSLARETMESSSNNRFVSNSQSGSDPNAVFRSRDEEDPFASRDQANDAFTGREPMDGAFETACSNAFMSSSISEAAGILSSGKGIGVQAKLEVGSPDDELEKEADQVADTVMRMPEDPLDEPNKESCETGACPMEEEEEKILPKLKSDGPIIQRQEAAPGAAPAPTPATTDTTSDADTTGGATETCADKKVETGIIVEDTAEELEAWQMKKSAFMRTLKASVKKTVAGALKGTGKEEEGLLAVETRFKTGTSKSARELEKQIKAEVPGAVGVKSAQGYIEKISAQVRGKVTAWVQIGMAGELPDIPGAGIIADMMAAKETAGEAVESGVKAVGSTVKSAAKSIGNFFGSLFSKSKDGGGKESESPQAIQSQLGEGRPLDGGLRSRMESAFGSTFSNVRVHNDSNAAGLSSGLNARAFTVGEHVAFGSGEYQPGTMVGDALIAHELAHTIQQGNAGPSVGDSVPMQKGDFGDSSLEIDADESAVGAVSSLWGGVKGKLGDIATNAGPRMKSGLKLQRCKPVPKCPAGRVWDVVGEPPAGGSLGCVCAWQCVPIAEANRQTAVMETYFNPQQGPSIGEKRNVPTKIVDTEYKKEGLMCFDQEGEKVCEEDPGVRLGYGAHFSPLTAKATCGCFPLDIETGEKTAAPMVDVGLDVTNLAGIKKREPRTGKIQPPMLSYPGRRGFKGATKQITLKKGEVIDRYGEESGKFVSPYKTPFGMRSLPKSYMTDKPYKVYKVVKPFKVESGEVMPWFDQPGGGTQHYLGKSIETLKNEGYIEEVK